MKNYIGTALLAAAALTLSSGSLSAQSKSTENKGYISIGPELGLPVGKLNDRYSWSLGVSAQADVPITEQILYFIANAGYSNFYTKNDAPTGVKDLQLMPVKVGLKIFPAENLYVQAGAGASFLLNKTKASYDKSVVFTYSPQVGYQFKVSNTDVIDAGINFQGNSKFSTGGSSNNLFAIRLSYGFGL